MFGCAEGGVGWFGVGCCWGGCCGCWFGAGCPGGGTGCCGLGATGCCGIMGCVAVVTVDMLGWLCFAPGTDGIVGWLVNRELWLTIPWTGGGREKQNNVTKKKWFCLWKTFFFSWKRENMLYGKTHTICKHWDTATKSLVNMNCCQRPTEYTGNSQRFFWLLAISTAICAAIWAAAIEAGFCQQAD